MHIYTGGIATETNTFSPLPTGLVDYDIWRAGDATGGDEYFCTATRVFQQMAADKGWDLTFSLQASAQPAGLTVRSAYEELRQELLDALEAARPVDMVLLPLHGAMVAVGYDDCETDILLRVRDIVGEKTTVGLLLDLHCDVTQEMVDLTDLIVLYKEFPHIDIADRARDLFELTAAAAEGRIEPASSLFDCRMIGSYPTSYGPLRTFVDDMLAQEGNDDLLSLSLVHGFPWADVPTVGTRMLAITNGNQEQADSVAQEWGRRFFSLRHHHFSRHNTSLQGDPLGRRACFNPVLSKGLGVPRIIPGPFPTGRIRLLWRRPILCLARILRSFWTSSKPRPDGLIRSISVS